MAFRTLREDYTRHHGEFAGFIALMGVFGIVPFAFLIPLTALEIGIAVLQAYIFTILSCVYLHDALHLH